MKCFIVPIISLFIFFAIFCLSCKEKQSAGDHPILKVDLKEQQVSVFDIFKSAEIIPLETSEKSLFSRIDKFEIYKDTIFIIDRRYSSIVMFDSRGRFINKLQKTGRGPGEYLLAYDFIIDRKNEIIQLLDPMGLSIYSYNFNGYFIRKDDLPAVLPNYQYFEMLDEYTYVTWSFAKFADEDGVNIINAKKSEVEYSFFPFTDIWGGYRAGSVFIDLAVIFIIMKAWPTKFIA